MEEMKAVIDADNMKVIERYKESQTKERLEHYKSLGRWDDVGVDANGDIILWED